MRLRLGHMVLLVASEEPQLVCSRCQPCPPTCMPSLLPEIRRILHCQTSCQSWTV